MWAPLESTADLQNGCIVGKEYLSSQEWYYDEYEAIKKWKVHFLKWEEMQHQMKKPWQLLDWLDGWHGDSLPRCWGTPVKELRSHFMQRHAVSENKGSGVQALGNGSLLLT